MKFYKIPNLQYFILNLTDVLNFLHKMDMKDRVIFLRILDFFPIKLLKFEYLL